MVLTLVDLNDVKRSLRIRPDSKVELRFDKLADDVLCEFEELAEIRSTWAFVANGFPGFPAGLARYSELILVAVTAGEPVSKRLSTLTAERQLFRANILDAMVNSALAVEQLRVDEEFRRAAHNRGMRLSRRFSPGCPHMSMEDMPALIEALDSEHKIGVTCTSAQMLMPVKSLAYVHGADAALRTDQPIDFCDTCRLTSCIRSRRNRDNS